MTADALAGLREEVARAMAETSLGDADFWNSFSPAVQRAWLATADRCIALIRPAVLREIADEGEARIDRLMREGNDASRNAAQLLVGHVNHLRALADAAERAPGAGGA